MLKFRVSSKLQSGVLMPLYDYHCQQCDSGFTELRKTFEMDFPISCPECFSMETHRSLSCFSVGSNKTVMSARSGSSKSQFR